MNYDEPVVHLLADPCFSGGIDVNVAVCCEFSCKCRCLSIKHSILLAINETRQSRPIPHVAESDMYPNKPFILFKPGTI